MKTDINKILKRGDKAKIKPVDYTTQSKQNELELLKKKCKTPIKNKSYR